MKHLIENHRPSEEANMSQFTLISHPLCPYVQRAAIVLAEKGCAFERKDIDLSNKPGWFLQVSPLGKTPVLLVDEQAIFESAVICEYLDDILMPRLHPDHPLPRAQHRAWMEFGSAILNQIGRFYHAGTEADLQCIAGDIKQQFSQIEAVLDKGPYFAGASFSMVDAVFGPVFRYFDVFDQLGDFGCLEGLPKAQVWRRHLAERPSVRQAVSPDYPQLLMAFLRRRQSVLAARANLAATSA